MLNTLLFTLAMAFTSCGGSESDAPQPATITITVSQEEIAAPAEGGTYMVDVATTGKEWGAYSNQDFVKLDTKNTTSQKGSITILLPENPTTEVRTATVTVMSGAARKAIAVTQAAAGKSSYNAPEGYKLVWHDEFDEGTELNSNDWIHEVQNAGWVNNELQYYANHVTPKGKPVTELKNGSLQIHCLKEDGKVYSGRVYAKRNEGWKYGYMEARIKLPKGKGTWPAFWMMPVNFKSWPTDGEIDIMEEVGYHPNYVSSSLHADDHVHTKGTQVTHEMLCEGAEDDYHVYAIEWTEKNITTYVDGKVQLSYDNRGKGHSDWPYDAPFYIIFNLAWGGMWGGQQGVDEGALPTTMEIDYVRVFQK